MSQDKAKTLKITTDQIEQKFGKGAIMKLGENTNMQVGVIPTGDLPLDIALGIGGVPRGRIVEVYGPESSGKTTIALHIIAEAQAAGGVVAFIVLFMGEDENRKLDERVRAFLTRGVTGDTDINIIDTAEFAIPGLDDEFRVIVSPWILSSLITDRLAAYYETVTKHNLNYRRYYHQFDY